MSVKILVGDVFDRLAELPGESVHCIVTSPPYWGLRDYGVAGQIGLEDTLDDYVAVMVEVGRELRRVLRPDGVFWLNLGDCYAGSWGAQSRGHNGAETQEGGSMLAARQIKAAPARGKGSKRTPGLKPKDLCMVPARVSLALQADGWWLRQRVIWHKPNPITESATDRCTSAFEEIAHLTKSARYWFDADAIKEPCDPANGRDSSAPRRATPPGAVPDSGFRKGRRFEKRNKRNVWTIPPDQFKEAHFATFPAELAETCIKAGCPLGGTVLDPFGGAGTTGLVADRLGRDAILIEMNPEYAEMARRRIEGDAPLFSDVGLKPAADGA